MSETLIVGVGNRFRRDDGVGPLIAEKMSALGYRTQLHEGDGAGLIDLFERFEDLTLIDAMQSGRPPGTILELDAIAEPMQAEMFRYSTHRFGLAEAVEAARALGALPKRLNVIGIEGRDFSAGEGLSSEVADAMGQLLSRFSSDP